MDNNLKKRGGNAQRGKAQTGYLDPCMAPTQEGIKGKKI